MTTTESPALSRLIALYGSRAAAALTRANDAWAANLGQSAESITAATLARTETVSRAYAAAAGLSLSAGRRAVAAIARHLGRVASGENVSVSMELGYGGVGDARGAWASLRATTRCLRLCGSAGGTPVVFSARAPSGLIFAEKDTGAIVGMAETAAWSRRLANGSMAAVLSGRRSSHARWLACSVPSVESAA